MAYLVLEEASAASELELSLNGLPLARAAAIRPGDRLRAGHAILRVCEDPRLAAAVGEPAIEYHVATPSVARGASGEPGDARHALARSPELVAEAPCMRRLLARVRKVASGESTVLLLGESGTGKEVVAQAIRANGPRAGKPFVSVNAAALGEAILESELFGHERGAFTGAIARRQGLFEAANGGTLFLDEVGELPPSTQAKLLRVLETREIRRVGGTETVKVDVRLISATNRDLRREAALGRFRVDLLYRLAVVELRIPPLRERPDDLEPLIRHLLDRLNREGRRSVSLSPEALARLRTLSFPGNVRELRNCLESAFNFCEDDLIRAEDLPAPHVRPPAIDGEFKTLATVERDHIEAALNHARWNKSRAASLLGIDRTTLYSKIEGYGLRPVGPTPVETAPHEPVTVTRNP